MTRHKGNSGNVDLCVFHCKLKGYFFFLLSQTVNLTVFYYNKSAITTLMCVYLPR